jgi:hypothetical protein
MRRYSPRCSRIQDITMAKTRFRGRGLPHGGSEAAEPSFIVRSAPRRTHREVLDVQCAAPRRGQVSGERFGMRQQHTREGGEGKTKESRFKLPFNS